MSAGRISCAGTAWHEVVEQTDQAVALLRARNATPHILFAELCAATIRHWRGARPRFGDPDFVGLVAAHFFRLYIDAALRPILGIPPRRRTPLWDRYFHLAARHGDPANLWSGLIVLRAGIEAHVVGDLEDAFRAALRSAGPSESEGPNLVRHAADLLGPVSTDVLRSATSDYLERLALTLPGPGPAALRRALLLVVQRGPGGVSVGTVQHWRRQAWRRALIQRR